MSPVKSGEASASQTSQSSNSPKQTGLRARVRDYYELTKPNVVLLMLLTSLVGMLLASREWIGWWVIIFGNLGIALCAGSAAAINHVIDRRVDQHMARTDQRPVARGRVSPRNAVIFAAVLALAGAAILYFLINPVVTWLTLASLIGYAFIYTIYLKRATSQNIVIGGLAGAAPPLLGWAAVSGTIDPHALLLVLIIFAWTPPHFWALAVHKRDEYAKVQYPMLPITHGVAYTKVQILLYSLLLFAASLLPFATRMLDWLYLLGALILGVGFLWYAWCLYTDRSKKAGMDLFWYSIIYLMALFVVMLADHYLIDPVYQVTVELVEPLAT